MEGKLNRKEFISVSLMLFAMFFGSGNLIFPAMLANQAGSSMWLALIGFAVTAVVFPVLGILAIAKTDGARNLAARVLPAFLVMVSVKLVSNKKMEGVYYGEVN